MTSSSESFIIENAGLSLVIWDSETNNTVFITEIINPFFQI